MQRSLIVLIVLIAAAACGDNRRSTHNGNEHHSTASSSASASPADHNAMGHDRMNHSGMKSSPGAASAPYDLQFLDTMMAHHKGAVEMASLADTRAQRAELKELAANIIYDQEREIAKMSGWREKWFSEKAEAVNMDFPGMAHGMGGMDLKKLESLRGNEFDLEFIRQMIPHHEGAVQMARDIKRQDSYAELKELADDIISAQDAEIKQMQEWLNQWGKGEKVKR